MVLLHRCNSHPPLTLLHEKELEHKAMALIESCYRLQPILQTQLMLAVLPKTKLTDLLDGYPTKPKHRKILHTKDI